MAPKFSSINIIEGTTNRMSRVPSAKPKTIDIAIGIRNCACSDSSNKIGVNPAMVVIEVNSTALRRWHAASMMASLGAMPCSRKPL